MIDYDNMMRATRAERIAEAMYPPVRAFCYRALEDRIVTDGESFTIKCVDAAEHAKLLKLLREEFGDVVS